MVPLSVHLEWEKRRVLGGTNGGVAILFSSFPRPPHTPPSGQPGQGKEVILYRKAPNETPEGQPGVPGVE